MRYKITFLIISLLICLGCQKDPKPSVTTKGSSEIYIDAVATTFPIMFNANYDWTISSSASWLNISPESGLSGDNTITVSAEANPDYESRTTTVTIKVKEAVEVFHITQYERKNFELSETNFFISSDGGVINIPIQANIDYFLEVADSSKSWLSVTQTKSLADYKIVLTASKNETYSQRVGKVYVSYGEKKDEISITQSQLDELIASTTTFEIGSNGGEIKVPVQTNIDYECSALESADEWISISTLQTKGLEDYFLVLRIEENKNYDGRVGQMKIVGAGKESILSISQSQMDEIIVSQTSFEMGSDGGTLSIPMQTNTSYEYEVIGDSSNWLSITDVKTKGLLDYCINLKVDKNSTFDGRVAQVKIAGAGKESIVTVTQSQFDEMIVGQSEFEIGSNGGVIKVPISTNIEYEATILSENANWIKVTNIQTKGLEDYFLVFTVANNTNYDGRVAQIKIVGAGKESILSISQSQMDEVLVGQTSLVIGQQGGEIAIPIQTNTNFEYTVIGEATEWLSVSNISTKAMIDTCIYAFASINETYSPRIGQIKIVGAGKESVVTINQAQKDGLFIEEENYEIDAIGGTLSIPIYANVDYEYSISDDAKDWITPIDTKSLVSSNIVFNVGVNLSKSSRSATLTVYHDNLKVTCFITQKGATFTNLSASETANCYILPKAGFYLFNATVIGNGEEGIIKDAGFHTENPNISPKSAQLLWTDRQELNPLIKLENGEILIYVNGAKGNSLVAVYSNENCTGDIVWSWHLWSTEMPGTVEITNHSGIQYSIMDRNLGSYAISKADPMYTSYYDLQGLHYQWGRKDPIPSSERDSRPFYGNINKISRVGSSIDKGTINYSIANPVTFIYYSSVSDRDWLFSERNNYLWGGIDKKTIYDPCPPGFKVPNKETFTGFTMYGNHTQAHDEFIVEGAWNDGWFFKTNNGTSFYPAAERMWAHTGIQEQTVSNGEYWLSEPSYNGEAYSLYFATQDIEPQRTYSDRAQGSAIRCVKYK